MPHVAPCPGSNHRPIRPRVGAALRHPARRAEQRPRGGRRRGLVRRRVRDQAGCPPGRSGGGREGLPGQRVRCAGAGVPKGAAAAESILDDDDEEEAGAGIAARLRRRGDGDGPSGPDRRRRLLGQSAQLRPRRDGRRFLLRPRRGRRRRQRGGRSVHLRQGCQEGGADCTGEEDGGEGDERRNWRSDCGADRRREAADGQLADGSAGGAARGAGPGRGGRVRHAHGRGVCLCR
mmetsp:Transcript_49970/g.150291  ORF Transcript_49970/g.150291 Transcript_49970/m.150291 type:complete len:234 (-) Transcript_49970:1933-2634(-)